VSVKYRVLVERERLHAESCTFEIEAGSEADAKTQAKAMAYDDGHAWGLTEGPEVVGVVVTLAGDF
jgi:hypothetical protein